MSIEYFFVPSPNYSKRHFEQIKFIVLHYTGVPFNAALDKLCDPLSKVSCHYLIKEDGKIIKLVDEENQALHAGQSSWKDYSGLDEYSIGIELDNLGNNPFPEVQMHACIDLCYKLMQKYNIAKENIIGHSDISPSRKLDPGIFFEWKMLAKYGIGKWHNIEVKNIKDKNYPLICYGARNTFITELQKNLAYIGYDINVNGIFDKKTNDVIRAFHAHFYPESIKNTSILFYQNLSSQYSWNSISQKILNNLL